MCSESLDRPSVCFYNINMKKMKNEKMKKERKKDDVRKKAGSICSRMSAALVRSTCADNCFAPDAAFVRSTCFQCSRLRISHHRAV